MPPHVAQSLRPHRIRRLVLRALLVACVLVVLAPGCRRFTKEAADEEVYGLLAARRAEVAELSGTLDVEAKERLADAIRTRETFKLTLRDALELGTVSAREYRRQREVVYLAALDLTRELNAFNPLWDAGGSVDLRGDEDGSEVDVALGLTLRRAFQRGGSVVIRLASDFLRNLSGNPLKVAQSILSADVNLPLMRGSGELIARERLTQAERNVMYALRDYARFQQEFTVDITSRFYRALQTRDSWQNSERRYENLKLLVAEQSEKAGAGRLPKFEVDQVEQDLLESDDTRQRRHNDYVTAIDRLKLDLGIPVSADVSLEDSDLEALREAGLQPIEQKRVDALRVAEARRLDLRTERDQEADAKRAVLVAKDALRAGLDLRLGGDLNTPGEQPLNFGNADASGNVGLDVDLPFERTNERNTYRRALITEVRAKRDRERFEDTVIFEVRDAYRSLEEAQRSFEIQEQSLRLAERRVESTQLLLELGDAKTRDRLDAETSLVAARNAVTAALVDHALARLGLARDVGTLRVDAAGMWQDHPAAPTAAAEAPAPGAAPTAGTSTDAGTPAPGAVVQSSMPAPVVRSRTGSAPPSATPSPTAPTSFPRSPPRTPVAPPKAAPPQQPAPAHQPVPADGSLPPPQVIPRRSGTVDTR